MFGHIHQAQSRGSPNIPSTGLDGGATRPLVFQLKSRQRRTNCCVIDLGPIEAGMRILLKPARNFICIGLALSLMVPAETLMAQAVDPNQTPPPAMLNIVIVEGEGAINNIRQRVARDPIVRVEDENRKPVAGAVVVFTLPTEGATGEFGGGAKSVTVTADAQGLAKAQGLKMMGIGGKLPIHVTASYRGRTARTTIMQFVEVPAGVKPGNPSGHGKLIAILVVVGGAAAGGAAYAASRKSSSPGVTTPTPPSGPTPIGIAPGTGTIAPPR